MPRIASAGAILLLAAAAAAAQEKLQYNVNWPTGLSLGEVTLSAASVGAEWDLKLAIDASIPGFVIRDSFTSRVSNAFCSAAFEKDSTHGARRSVEKSVFDKSRGVVVRETLKGGGKSETPFTGCARDALAFLYHLRQELEAGRIPPPQTVFFGAAYQAKLQFRGAERVKVGEERIEADHITATLKGPASDLTFDLFFARDSGRTPVLVRVPFSMGVFSMELQR